MSAQCFLSFGGFSRGEQFPTIKATLHSENTWRLLSTKGCALRTRGTLYVDDLSLQEKFSCSVSLDLHFLASGLPDAMRMFLESPRGFSFLGKAPVLAIGINDSSIDTSMLKVWQAVTDSSVLPTHRDSCEHDGCRYLFYEEASTQGIIVEALASRLPAIAESMLTIWQGVSQEVPIVSKQEDSMKPVVQFRGNRHKKHKRQRKIA